MPQAKTSVEESRRVAMKCAGYKNHPQGAEVEFPAGEAAELVAKGWAVYIGGTPATKTPSPEPKSVATAPVPVPNPPTATDTTPTK